MASQTPTISIKLLINLESNTVLLAEAGSDFVNTLHSLLKLPLGNIARLADMHQCLQPGCLNNLYNSVENLGLEIFRTKACKHMLLYPRNVHDVEFKKLKLNMDLSVPTGCFVCGNVECSEIFGGLFSYYKGTRCICEWGANRDIRQFIKIDAVKDETEGVLYRGESMFFITDDLRVMQGSPDDLIQFLLNMGLKNVSRVEEKVVEIERGIGSGTTPMLDELFSTIAPKEKESAEKDGKTRVKLMLRKSDRKVLYAESSEDFVDLVFSFLTIPLESVLEMVLVAKGSLTLGSISNLFRDLNTIFSVSKQKNSQQGVLPPFYSCPKEFPNICSRDPPKYYHVFTHYDHLTEGEKDTKIYLQPMDPKSPERIPTNSSGYVEKNSFVVTDDLVVQPRSSVSSISLLLEIGIQLDDVESKVISIGEVEAIALLGACLWSSSALTASLNSFAKKPKQEPL
ncbi:hypothetical protein GQ457_14G023760 [Hibiscus cannabinus]